MAHKKGGGTTRNGRDSESKRLGVKVYGGQAINAGGIIIRQRGTPVRAGENAAWARITPCSRWSTARSSLLSRAPVRSNSSPSSRTKWLQSLLKFHALLAAHTL